jgi:hypothetical protein
MTRDLEDCGPSCFSRSATNVSISQIDGQIVVRCSATTRHARDQAEQVLRARYTPGGARLVDRLGELPQIQVRVDPRAARYVAQRRRRRT